MNYFVTKYKNLAATSKTACMLCGVVLTMGALSWASVPFYDWFCRVTGFGGVTARSDVGSDIVLNKKIMVYFDASTADGMPWEFKPKAKEISLNIGETGLAFYEAHNPTQRPITGTASYNVVPYDAGNYFVKIDCFCFVEQTLQPGERVDMPVTFYIDPDMLEDERVRATPRITLSYTFYEKKPNREELLSNR